MENTLLLSRRLLTIAGRITRFMVGNFMMWDVVQGYSYLWINILGSTNFTRLENFPTHAPEICQVDYLIFCNGQKIPILLPYQEKHYTEDCSQQIKHTFHPWRRLSRVIQELEEHSNIQGKMTISFSPIKTFPKVWNDVIPLHYFMDKQEYGCMMWFERCAKLRKPHDFPTTSNWFYQTKYLTFHHIYNRSRAFFSHASEGKLKNQNTWETFLTANYQHTNKHVIYNLYKDHWGLHGELETTFLGIDCVDEKKIDFLQFLFLPIPKLLES